MFPADRGYRRGSPVTFDDPLWGIVGIIDDDGPTDVSVNYDRFLADAYAGLHHEPST